MGSTIHINSSAQWRQTLSSNSVVVVDFYADWCGPCKMIAPTFESLSTKYSKPKKIAFCKVDVDKLQDISQQYGVRAMPTFLVLHNSSVTQTISGANPPALTAAVEKAVKLAGSGGGSSFGTQGRTLGGAGLGGPARQSLGRPIKWDINSLVRAIYTFIGLYLVSLVSLDPYKSAENSQFNRKNPPPRAPAAGGPGGQRPAQKATFRTMADL